MNEVLKIACLFSTALLFILSCSLSSTEKEDGKSKNRNNNIKIVVNDTVIKKSRSIHEKNNTKLPEGLKLMRAKYKEFMIGDSGHWIFIGEDGNEYNFMGNDQRIIILDDGNKANHRYIGKIFNVYYKAEQIDIGIEGSNFIDADVIKKIELSK